MNNPLISVIVPCYKVESFLPLCIESIISQTYKNIEIILIDDGSPDSTGKICDDYVLRDNRIKVIHKNNEGIVKARIDGTMTSRGDYLCYVDSDDFLSVNILEEFARVILDKNPDLICCGKVKFSEENQTPEPLVEREGYYDKNSMERYIYASVMERNDGYYFSHSMWAKCFKRNLAINIHKQIDPSMRMGEDFVFIASYLLIASSLYIIKDCLYHYRYNPSSLSNNRKPFSWFFPESFDSFIHKYINLELYDLKEQYYRAMTHIIMRTAVSQFYSTKPIASIKEDINKHLSLYESVLDSVSYASLKHRLMVWALRHRQYCLLRLYSSPFIQRRMHE